MKRERLIALFCMFVFLLPASAGDVSWTGRERHIAVVNPVSRPADDPCALSLRGKWTFVPCPTGGYRQSQMPKGRTWHWEDDPSIVHEVSVPGCWEASGAIPGTGMSHPWTCWDKSPLEIHGLHVGAGWYKRKVKIPAAWRGSRIWFKPGWVNCVGSFWVNGEAVAMEYDNYCGTYKYDVTDLVTPGEEALVVVEAINDFPSFRGCFNFVNRWGGIIRAPEFEATPKDAWIDDAWVRGDFDGRCAEVHVTVGAGTRDASPCQIRVTIEGTTVSQPLQPLQPLKPLKLPLRNFRPWSPEHPNLYTAKVELVSASGEVLQTRYERFGVRKFERRGGGLFLNNRPFFARGAGWHDINPIEGAAPCDRAHWLKAGRRVKEAGFNYIRLHTQARSPEFFEACDELGLMVQPELPYYTDVPSDRQRFDPLADAEQLYLAYRRHPSFATYSGGNEGSFGPVLGKRLYDEIKARDPDRLVMGQDCYPSAAYNKPGTSDFAAAPTTVWPRGSFRDERPFIAHEYMNLSVKLDYRLEGKFTGVWVPPITRKSREAFLAKSGLSMETGDRLQEAQHALQAVWRKYGIESARLDPECDGYSFWSLQDVCVPNKGTPAAQALFDPFWGDKRGGETAAQVAVYNSPSCVLMRDGADPERWERDDRNLRGWHNLFADSMATNRVRQAGEILRARFYFAHYGASDLQEATLAWRLTAADGRVLAAGSRDIGAQPVGGVRPVGADDIVIPEIETATKATLAATITSKDAAPFSNSWNYWLFPGRRPLPAYGVACADEIRPHLEGRYADLVHESGWRSAHVVIAMRGSALEAEALACGKNVVSLSGQSGGPNILLGWWWMGSQMGSVLNDHPWLDGFPHDGVFSPLFFRIAKCGLKLPVPGVSEKDIVMVGEGAEACYLYLAESRSREGGRVCHIAGLDVLSDTPEGTMILDGAIRRLGPSVTDRGSGRYEIDLPANAAPHEATAAAELDAYLSRLAAGAVAVGGYGPAVFHVGDTKFAVEKGLGSAGMEDEAWVVKSFGGDVVLNGGGPRGAIYAVAHFLEDRCGVRWWSETEERIPAPAPLKFKALDDRGRPAFRGRDISPTKNGVESSIRFSVLNRLNCRPWGCTAEQRARWGCGRLDVGSPAACHTFGRHIPAERYGKDHPEWFAYSTNATKRILNSHYAQLCLTNPEVLDKMTESVLASISADEVRSRKDGVPPPFVYDVSQNDGEQFCECPACLAVRRRKGDSGYLLDFVNAVASRVGRVRPGILVRTFAYLNTESPPKTPVVPAENVVVRLCDTKSNMAASYYSAENTYFKTLVEEWGRVAKRLEVWDYSITYTTGLTGLPFASELFCADALRHSISNRVEWYFFEHEAPHMADMWELKRFVEAKLLENPALDNVSLVNRFCEEYYGAAAPMILEYRRRLHLVRERRGGRIEWFPRSIRDWDFIHGEDIEEWQALFDRAEKSVEGNGVLFARVRQARQSLDRLVSLRQIKLGVGGGHGVEAARARLRDTWRTRLGRHRDLSQAKVRDILETTCGVPTPPGFAGRKIQVFTSSFLRGNSSVIEQVDDRESFFGRAKRLDASSGGNYALPFACGLYDCAKRKTLCECAFASVGWKGYKWIKIGTATIPRTSYVWFTRSWCLQHDLKRSAELAGRTFDIWASVKFTGPLFQKGESGRSHVWVDGVVLEEFDKKRREK